MPRIVSLYSTANPRLSHDRPCLNGDIYHFSDYGVGAALVVVETAVRGLVRVDL